MTNEKSDKNKSFPRLHPVLEALGLDNTITVKSVYGGQYGWLVFSHKEFNEIRKNERPISEFENFTDKYKDDASWKGLPKEFCDALSSNSNIFNADNIRSDEFSVKGVNYGRWLIDTNNTLTLTMKIPPKHKKFNWTNSGLSINEFEVYTNGSAHFAVAHLNDAPALFHIGHEFREQMRISLDNNDFNYRLGQIGPSPIHPDFYLVYIEEDILSAPLVKGYNNDIYFFVCEKTESTLAETYISLMQYIKYPMFEFYTQNMLRSIIFEYYTEIEARLNELIENCESIQSSPLRLSLSKREEITAAKKNLLDLHSRHFQFEKLRRSHERESIHTQSVIEDNDVLLHVGEYFKEVQELEIQFDASFERTVDYLDRSISTTDQGQKILLSGILGTIIGTLLTILFQ